MRADRRNPKHLAWLRTLPCIVPDCQTGTPVQSHHIRSAGNSGVGLKPPDTSTIPVCAYHHSESHRIGQRTFAAKYGIDLAAEAHRLSAGVRLGQAGVPPEGLL